MVGGPRIFADMDHDPNPPDFRGPIVVSTMTPQRRFERTCDDSVMATGAVAGSDQFAILSSDDH